MEAKQLDRCIRRLSCRWPLLGGWLRRRAARQLAEDGSPQAIGALTQTATETTEARLHVIVWEAVSRVQKEECIIAVCHVWANTRNPRLGALLFVRQWIPKNPVPLRVLTALHCGQEAGLCRAGPSVVEPLMEFCGDADAGIADRARATLAA